MRVSLGRDYRRRYVLDAQVGTAPVVRIMRGGAELWPGDADRVASVVLDLAAVQGDVLWAHALDAVAGGADKDHIISCVVGGRRFAVNAGYGGWTVARLDNGSLRFDGRGPFRGSVKVGDTVVLRAEIGERRGPCWGGAGTDLPLLPETQLRVSWGKMHKRSSAGRRFTVTGLPSGMVHFGGMCHTDAHKRGRFARTLPGNTHKWTSRVYNGEPVPGDTALGIETSLAGDASTTYGGVELVWPAFEVEWECEVLGVTYEG